MSAEQTHSLPNVLLVEDNSDHGALIGLLLRDVAHINWATSGEAGVALFDTQDWDLVISDVDLPGINGLEVVRRAKAALPLVSTLILTGHTSFDNAVEALRAGADNFVTKPFDREALLTPVVELLALAAARKQASRRVVLAIGAHPDDVEIGCGGILLAHVSRGDTVVILTLTGGEQGGEPGARTLESQHAAELMSARLVQADLADTNISETGSTIDTIERLIEEIEPAAIYTHTIHDVHQDHRNVHRATLVAARKVPSVYCYQSPSSTVEFRPTRFVEIDDFVERKIEVIGAYKSQVALRRYLEDDVLRATARYWSRYAYTRYSEPLEVVRDTEAGYAQPSAAPLDGVAAE
jgi:LmbE family N-acetylglucosaminyl deacetylase